MPTNKQRRDAARRHLERQLARRVEQEASRKRATLIASIVGTIVLIAVIITCIVLLGGGSKKGPAASSSSPTTTATSTATTPSATPSTSYPPATGAAVTFRGVTVKGATDLAGYPVVTSKSSTAPPKLEYKDLVVGKGTAATPTSTVTVQYVGVLYKNGKEFDSSWKRGSPAVFPLTGVVPGFTQGIGGTKGVPAMRIGGRRIVIMPSALGYGANPQAGSGIPKNAALAFVIDLKSVEP